VSTDTRTLERGELFVALRGPRFNGNEFVAQAHAAGAAGAVVDAPQVTPLAQVIVAESQAALARAAQQWRGRFDIPVIGVAGSNGKTSTKEMTAAILARSGACLATRGNLNNHIGVPLTLLRLGPSIAPPSLKWAPIKAATSPLSSSSPRPPSASSPMREPSTWKASALSRPPRAPRARWSRDCPPPAPP
jgi:hypothetical protein